MAGDLIDLFIRIARRAPRDDDVWRGAEWAESLKDDVTRGCEGLASQEPLGGGDSGSIRKPRGRWGFEIAVAMHGLGSTITKESHRHHWDMLMFVK